MEKINLCSTTSKEAELIEVPKLAALELIVYGGRKFKRKNQGDLSSNFPTLYVSEDDTASLIH